MQTIALKLTVGSRNWCLVAYLIPMRSKNYLSHSLDAFPSEYIRTFIVLKLSTLLSQGPDVLFEGHLSNSKINWTVLPTNPWMRYLKVSEPLNLFPFIFTRQYPPISNSLQLLLILSNLSSFLLFSVSTFPNLKENSPLEILFLAYELSYYWISLRLYLRNSKFKFRTCLYRPRSHWGGDLQEWRWIVETIS